MRPSSSQEVPVDEQEQTGRAPVLYRRATVWGRITPDDTHGHGCALVWAGLLPIIGEFFYECQVTAIPENGSHTDGETQLGRWYATRESVTRFQTEMVSNKRYEVRVSRFGQKKGLSAHMTSGRFDFIPLSESMAVAIRHLLLYLGSGRDKRSSYRIYHDYLSRASEGGIRKYSTLFGMARFPWSPEPHTATTARMINLAFDDAYPAPDLDWGSASWRHFCDSPLKDTWEEVRMRHFQYETYKAEERRRRRPRDLPPSDTPPGSPPAPSPRPSIPPASIPSADAGSQLVTPATATLPSSAAHQGPSPANRDQANGSSPADGLSRGSGGLSGGPFAGPGRLSSGVSPPGMLLPSHGGDGFLIGGQTTSEGQYTIEQAGSSTAVVRTPIGTGQGGRGTSMYYTPPAVYGQDEQSRAPGGWGWTGH
ncbi:hypothetical protein INS49_004618 [Diaporthe citri]|uniref:uncharacterized protein n=1 Tax=Diaporthe citri TaxID=83186 RepID=UPI001C809A9B|nr:uncharacterized protein INS49_004618 [Diaporthe citri]KAG6354600.1 hypothetical protein INS49_004618 [Diaporthe citri]